MAQRILGVSGGLQNDSPPSHLLRCAAATAAELPDPIEVEILTADVLAALPHFRAVGAESLPPSAVTLRESLADADGLLLATSEENCSYPGVLKDAIDWSGLRVPDSPLHELPVAVVGASDDDFGADWAQADVRKVLDAAGTRVLAAEVSVPDAGTAFDDDGTLADPALDVRLRELLSDLASEAMARSAVN